MAAMTTPNGRGQGIRLGVLVSYLRQEEKLILATARARGIDVRPLFDRELFYAVQPEARLAQLIERYAAVFA